MKLKQSKIKQSGIVFGFLFAGFVSAQEEVSYPELKWTGDLRFRHEHVERQGAAVSSYEQQRIRARLGLLSKVEEDMQLEFRLATGAGRTSTNQTLGNNSSSSDSTHAMANYGFLLDRANFDYRLIPELNLRGGRFGNPFYQPADSDLIWDADLNFDGLALKSSWETDSAKFFANTGFFWILKDLATPKKDVIMGAVQLGTQLKFSEDSKLGFEVAYYAYSGIRGHQGLTSAGSTDGNTFEVSGTKKLYDKSFKLVDVGWDYQTRVYEAPITFFNQYVTNTKANPRPGWIAGFKLGALKKKGDGLFYYDYRRVPENSTVGAFTDGDSFGGGTNGWSHKVGLSYQLKKSTTLGLAYNHGKVNIAKGQESKNRKLGQLDLIVKF